MTFASGISSDASAEISIMAMGDSISRGGHVAAADRYRQLVTDSLTSNDVAHQFTGEFSDQVSRHQAVGGASIQFMTENYRQAIEDNQPDYILLLAGTNNHNDAPNEAEFVDRYEALFGMIRSASPDTQVIISTVPKFAYDRPNTPFWTEEYVDYRNEVVFPTINSAIQQTAEERDWVKVVDLFSEIDIETDYVSDAVHLNANGQEKLGTLFEDALLSSVAVAVPEPSGFFLAALLFGFGVARRNRRQKA